MQENKNNSKPVDIETPLTNEELALFSTIDNRLSVGGYQVFIKEIMKEFKEELIYLHGRIDQIEFTQNEIAKQISNGFEMLANALSGNSNSSIKTTTIVQPEQIANLFTTDMNAAQKSYWVSKAKGIISSMVLENSKMGYATAWSKVYNGMAEDGYDVIEMFKEYSATHPNTTSKIQMIVASDALQKSFMRSAEKIEKANATTNKEAHKKKSSVKKQRKDTHRTPKEVEDLVVRFSQTGKLGGKVYHRVFTELENNGVNLDKVVEEAKKRLGRNNVKRSIAISMDSEAMNVLRKLSNECVNRKVAV